MGRIPKSLAFTGFAVFVLLAAERTKAAAEPSRVFVRVTVEDVEPAEPVLIGVSVFRAYHETLAKFSPARNDRRKDFSVGWHDSLPWRDLGPEYQLAAGRQTGWIEITEVMAMRPKNERIDDPNRPVDVTDLLNIHPPLKTFAFGFHAPTRPPRVYPGWYKSDAGNVERVTARIEFADRPADDAIRKQVRYESQSSVIAVIVPDSATPLTHWADDIRTMHEYTTDRLAAVQKRGITRQPLPRRLLVSGSAMSGCFFPTLRPPDGRGRSGTAAVAGYSPSPRRSGTRLLG